MSIDPSAKCTLVAPDGGVRYVPIYMRDELLKKGFKIINNPKREYYPEWDSTLPGYQSNMEENNEESSNFLEVKIL